MFVATPVFDGATVEDVDEALVRWQEEHADSPVQFEIDKSAPRRAAAARARCSCSTAAPASPTSSR